MRHQDQRGHVWRLALALPDQAGAEAVAAALGTVCGAVSAFEAASGGAWRVEGFATAPPDRRRLDIALALACAGRNDAPPAVEIERLEPRDWLGENQASFSPLSAGRYFIHPSHYAGAIPAGRIGLRIDAATAFGTGEHASTRGCLLALDWVARRRRPRRILDMGTGTGILAIAAAATWPARVLARDIDGEAVRLAAANAVLNGVGSWVTVGPSNGYAGRGLCPGAFDLVLATILAAPLARMATGLARVLAPSGIAVLSGLLARQERQVLAAHRAQRLILLRRIAVAGWHTLILARPGVIA